MTVGPDSIEGDLGLLGLQAAVEPCRVYYTLSLRAD